MNWQPTPELRWFERKIPFGDEVCYYEPVLQQKWVGMVTLETGIPCLDYSSAIPTLDEWRDLPTVKDEK